MDSLYQWEKLSEADSELINQLDDRQLIRIVVEDKNICVTRLDNAIYGIHDRCPHAGTPLTHAKTCNLRGVVTCPTHHYKFDIKTGLSADGNNYKISNYRFKLENGDWWIGSRG